MTSNGSRKSNTTARTIARVALVAAVIAVPIAAWARVTLPHRFTAGTPIRAAEVNANFDALNDGKQDRIGALVVRTPMTATPRFLIDHPLANGNPNAVLSAQHVSRASGDTFSNTVGFFYSAGDSRWMIFNEGPGNFPADTIFHVLIVREAQ
ncbi:MAG: hypothetical protein JNK05_19150 [Myxococcales bacterium]|nr:hypothetical protein [Myxococcales bacterium]